LHEVQDASEVEFLMGNHSFSNHKLTHRYSIGRNAMKQSEIIRCTSNFPLITEPHDGRPRAADYENKDIEAYPILTRAEGEEDSSMLEYDFVQQ
jgi:hypothetical protein